MAVVSAVWCRKVAGGSVELRCVGLLSFLAAVQQLVQVQDLRSMGCVPARCISTDCLFSSLGVGCYCGSLQSHCAMVLLQISVCFLLSLLCSGGGSGVDGDGQQAVVLASTEGLKDVFVFSFFIKGPLCKLGWTAILCVSF